MNTYQVQINVSCDCCGKPVYFEGLCDECEGAEFARPGSFEEEEEEIEVHTVTLTNQTTGKKVVATATKKCMGCGKTKVFEGEHAPLNALSRYRDRYICSDCGEKEAMTGTPYFMF